MPSKKIRYFAIIGLGLLIIAWLVLWLSAPEEQEPVDLTPTTSTSTIPTQVQTDPRQQIIGTSVEGRDIESFTYGTGDTHLVFVGGIHGGYEWNSVLLAYEFMDHIEANSSFIPEDLTVTIIPSANPDGVFTVIKKEGRFSLADVPEGNAAPGRFNANGVDLNRNFDCKWQPESRWRGEVVSAGTEAFSEPEARALRDFVLQEQPDAVVFWHSQADAVYASECENGVLPETLVLMQTYADAADYKAVPSFDAYLVTGDAEGWLASINIPAVTVELSTHETLDWERNLAGVEALFTQYAGQPQSKIGI